jgi:hypothetical protein
MNTADLVLSNYIQNSILTVKGKKKSLLRTNLTGLVFVIRISTL